MVKTLVVGDLHFDTKPFGLLKAQEDAVKQIIWKYENKVDRIIFLGDLMMHRRPYPGVLLALKRMLDQASRNCDVYILRGNHDSENKNDDGVTALSLFDNVTVATETVNLPEATLIAHYEDQERIAEELANVPKGDIVYGHFGFAGCLNSGGDADFDFGIDKFYNPAILGHIHGHRVTRGGSGTICTLGTPYTTNFTEAGKDNYIALVDGQDITFEEVDFGPRHLIVNLEDVEQNLDFINDPRYFTMLRVMLNSVEQDQQSVSQVLESVNVGYVETKYRKIYHEDYDPGDYDTSAPVAEITDDIIEEYINSSSTKIPKSELLDGLKQIYENQKNRDQ